MIKKIPVFFILLILVLVNASPSLGLAAPSQPFAYEAKGRRDPFQPWTENAAKTTEGMDTGDLRVEGIIIDPVKGSLAVINGAVVREGEAIGTYKVSKIEKARVQVSSKNQSQWLPFKTGDEIN